MTKRRKRSDVEVGEAGRGGSSSHAKIIIESLLSDAPYERKAGYKSHTTRPSVINPVGGVGGTHHHPPPADTPPSLRQQRKKYQDREDRLVFKHAVTDQDHFKTEDHLKSKDDLENVENRQG